MVNLKDFQVTKILSEDAELARSEAMATVFKELSTSLKEAVESNKFVEAKDLGNTLGHLILESHQIEMLSGLSEDARKMANHVSKKNFNLGGLDE